MSVKVITTQWCPVWNTTPKKAAVNTNGEGIAAGQDIEVESLIPMHGDLILVVWPPSLYPNYLGRGHMAFIEPAHVKPIDSPAPAGKVASVVVNFTDGTSQTFGASTTAWQITWKS